MEELKKLLALLEANDALIEYCHKMISQVEVDDKTRWQYIQSKLNVLNDDRKVLLQKLENKYNILKKEP